MGTDIKTAAGLLIVYLGIRIVDALLPGGRRFRVLDRWTTKDKDEEKPDET